MRYEVEIQLNFLLSMKHLSHILMGLLLLSQKKVIELTWNHKTKVEPENSALKILVNKANTNRQIAIAFDMRDMSCEFDKLLLKNSNFYFKRSFYLNDVELLPLELQEKVKVYGMILPTSSSSLITRVLTNATLNCLRNVTNAPRQVMDLIRDYFNDYHQFIGLPSPEEYLQSPNLKVRNTVFFQTRLWEQEYVGIDNANQINSMRSQLIRALRKNFNDRYIGGLLPTAYAKKYFPDCITTNATDSRGYIKLLKSNLVGIYSRGLNHSIALKMSEYIAASQCIVTESIRNQVSGSFVEGENYLEFSDVDSCINQCEKLLTDKEFAQYMRQENHRYYLENLDPASKALHCLDQVYSE